MTEARLYERSDLDTARVLPRTIASWKWFGIGLASAVVGLLPWIITGMRLPLQNLWATNTLPDDMPIALLPFSQYSITLTAGLIVVGATAAGLVGRTTRAHQGRRGFVALVAGVLLVQLCAIVQTATVVRAGLRPGLESMIYLTAIAAVAVASFAVGALVLLMIARMPRPGALIGMSLAAVAASWWVHALVLPHPALASATQITLLGLLRWVPAILCGIAIAWCGINTVGRVIAAIVAVAAVVIGPSFATAVTSAVGSRVLARHPAEMLEYGVQVFQSALRQAELTVLPMVAVIIVAAAGLTLKAVLRRRVIVAEAGSSI